MLAATQDTPLADQLGQALSRYEGVHLIALSDDDMPARRERLLAAGFKMQPIVDLHGGSTLLSPSKEAADARVGGQEVADLRLKLPRGARIAADASLGGLALTTGWARIEAGEHHPADVLAGAA